MKALINKSSSEGKERTFRSTSVDLLEGQDLDRGSTPCDLSDEAMGVQQSTTRHVYE